MIRNLLSSDNAVFKSYAFYTVILVFKMILLSFMTGIQRQRKKTFISPEDVIGGVGQVKYDDDDVERFRRAHLNDLENIPIFIMVGLLFVLADPNEVLAMMLFRVFTIARILHTIVYTIYIVRQPARVICFTTGVLCVITMGIIVISKFTQF